MQAGAKQVRNKEQTKEWKTNRKTEKLINMKKDGQTERKMKERKIERKK